MEMTEKLMESNRLLETSQEHVSDLEIRLEMESEKVRNFCLLHMIIKVRGRDNYIL